MSVPGFTAEAVLGRSGDRRQHSGSGAGLDKSARSQGIVPQNIECDIYIACVDGIRYLVRDCSDGSGDETPIGTCPRPWWLALAPYIYHPWFAAYR
jgi:hypothetical protein